MTRPSFTVRYVWPPILIAGVMGAIAVFSVTAQEAWLAPSGRLAVFNAMDQLRVLGRWRRMITVPNQSSVARAYEQFDEAGRMLPSPYYDRVIDVMEKLVKSTLLTRGVSATLIDRYSERKKTVATLEARVALAAQA